MTKVALSDLVDLSAAIQKAYDSVGMASNTPAQDKQFTANGDRLDAEWNKLAGQYLDDQSADYKKAKPAIDNVNAKLRAVSKSVTSAQQTLVSLNDLVKAVDSLVALAVPFA